MREHTTQWGISCTPGGQERPKVAPLTYYGEGRPMKQHLKTRFSYYGNLHRDFALIITLHHNVIETWGWAHFTQPTNQTPRIFMKLSIHALATI